MEEPEPDWVAWYGPGIFGWPAKREMHAEENPLTHWQEWKFKRWPTNKLYFIVLFLLPIVRLRTIDLFWLSDSSTSEDLTQWLYVCKFATMRPWFDQLKTCDSVWIKGTFLLVLMIVIRDACSTADIFNGCSSRLVIYQMVTKWSTSGLLVSSCATDCHWMAFKKCIYVHL